MEGELAHIGAGLAAIGSGAAAIGVGNVAGNFLAGALRNPSAAASQTATLFIGIAFAEALGIFSFLVALLLMFAVEDRSNNSVACIQVQVTSSLRSGGLRNASRPM
jgi:F-type H+-transporting ATPase subunit c